MNRQDIKDKLEIERAIEFLESKKKKYDRNDPCVGCSRDFGCGSCHYANTYLRNREHRENYKYNSTYEECVANEYNLNYNLAILALQEKLDREENKALTLEQLKSLTGKKVYRQPKLAPPQEVKINEIFQNNMVEIQLNCGRGALIDFNDYNFYEHKPVEVEHVTK